MLTAFEWRRILRPEVDRIRPSLVGWQERSVSILLDDGSVKTWSVALTKSAAERQREEIARCQSKRLAG